MSDDELLFALALHFADQNDRSALHKVVHAYLKTRASEHAQRHQEASQACDKIAAKMKAHGICLTN